MSSADLLEKSPRASTVITKKARRPPQTTVNAFTVVSV
jgi:hypothetical protein